MNLFQHKYNLFLLVCNPDFEGVFHSYSQHSESGSNQDKRFILKKLHIPLEIPRTK